MNRQTVLLVDDDPTQTTILDAYFMGLGASEVFQAENAAAALRIVNDQAAGIDLIVVDLVMQEMDGIELLRELKERGFTGEVAIVSGLDMKMIESARKLALLHGLNVIGGCRKPLTKQALDSTFLRFGEKLRVANVTREQKVTDRMVLQGLDEGAFIAYYQPKIDVASKRIVSLEALVRWNHAELGLIGPNEFLPIITRNNLSDRLTDNMIEAVTGDLSKWKSSGIDIRAALNVEAGELDALRFPDRLLNKLKVQGIATDRLILEVTENSVFDLNSVSLEVLTRLRLSGVEVAIDDFGTGFSNIKTLRDFPYDELKIDRNFIRGVTKDRFSQETVRASVALGRQMGMRVVAEGIETLDEWNFVKQLGIDQVQGYLLSRPISADEFVHFYKRHDGRVFLEDDQANRGTA